MADMSAKRGPFTQSCKNCTHYEGKRCTKLDIKVNERDWCEDYEED